jgi:homoserine kinase type II
VAPAHLAQVGAALARIHGAGGDAPADRFGGAELGARLERLRAEVLPAEIAEAVALLGDRLAELASRPRSEPCVIHGDVFRDNVLWDGEALSAVLDFESASSGDAPFDVMVTLLAWCFGSELEQPLARALVGAYRSERPLDIEACFDAARAAAVRFAITRIGDYELRPRGVVVYKDYRRFLARLAAIEAIGRSRFVDWLNGP